MVAIEVLLFIQLFLVAITGAISAKIFKNFGMVLLFQAIILILFIFLIPSLM